MCLIGEAPSSPEAETCSRRAERSTAQLPATLFPPAAGKSRELTLVRLERFGRRFIEISIAQKYPCTCRERYRYPSDRKETPGAGAVYLVAGSLKGSRQLQAFFNLVGGN